MVRSKQTWIDYSFLNFYILGIKVFYKFLRTVKCGAGNTVLIWSSDSGEEHIPSEGWLVMKEGSWKMGDTTNTILDKEGKVITKEKGAFGTSRYKIKNVMFEMQSFCSTGDLLEL
jgi:hypothetical protein